MKMRRDICISDSLKVPEKEDALFYGSRGLKGLISRKVIDTLYEES